MTDHNNMWFTDSSGPLNHCRFLHMETVLIVYLRARHCVTTNIDFWRKWNFSFLRAFPTALDIDIHYKTNLCPLLNVTGGPLAQLDETGEIWPESNQLSLFNLFIASHIFTSVVNIFAFFTTEFAVLNTHLALNCAWELAPVNCA